MTHHKPLVAKVVVVLLLGLAAVLATSPFDLNPPFNVNSPSPLGSFVMSGDTKLTQKGIVLTQSPSQTGALWNPTPVSFTSWQVLIKFYVTGSSTSGDHGFGFWYTATPGTEGPGEIYGHADKFTGLGILFDSKDNDGHRNNPSVAAHLYDGSKLFNQADDGVGDQLGGCVADYRNRPEPVTVRITYRRPSRLDVYLDLANKGRFQRCLTLETVYLPENFYFGITANTVESDDAHVIESFIVNDLSEPSDRQHIPAHINAAPPAQQQAPPQQQQQQQQQQQSGAAPPAVHTNALKEVLSQELARVWEQTYRPSIDTLLQSHMQTLKSSIDALSSHVRSLPVAAGGSPAPPQPQGAAPVLLGGDVHHKMDQILNTFREETSKLPDAIASKAFDQLKTLHTKLDELQRTVSATQKVAEASANRGTDTKLADKLEAVLREVQNSHRDQASASSSKEILSAIERLSRSLPDVEGRLGSLSANMANSGGVSWLIYLLLLSIIGLLVAVYLQNRSSSRFDKLP